MRSAPGESGVRPPVPGPRPPPAGAAWPALLAVAELRGRILLRRLRGRGGWSELVARVALYVVAIPAGLVFAGLSGAGAWHAVKAGTGIQAEVPVTAMFFGVWQTWTAIALSLTERDALDLRRFLVYPIPPARVFAYGLAGAVLGDPFAVFWCLLLAGAFFGAALARPGAWILLLALTYALFVAATVALVALVQELLGRLLRGRRVRELAIATVYMGTGLVLAWASAGPRHVFDAIRAVKTLRWVAVPAALADAAGRALYAERTAEGAAWVAALLVATAAIGGAAYRLALSDALSGGAEQPRAAATGRGGWRLPGRLGALLEKEGKYVLRHPLAAVLALVVPGLSALVVWKLAPRIPAEAGDVVRALPLFLFAVYAHLATQVFWLNAFGFDRGGARVYFLAPVPAADVLLAKNLATYGFSLALFAASAGAGLAVGGGTRAWALAAAIALHAGIAPWLLAAGNVVSLLAARPAPHTVQRGGALSPVAALAGMGIVSAAAALFGAPVLLVIRAGEPWALVAAWAGLGVAGAAVYGAALPRVARLLAARQEPILEAVCGDDA